MPDEYDRILKENLVELAPSLLRLMIGLEFETVEAINMELVNTVKKIPDFVHIIRTTEGEKAILHIEFQRSLNEEMTNRMLLYQGLLKLKYPKLTTYQYVVYIGEKNHNIQPNYQHPKGWQFKYDIINLLEMDYKRFLASDNPEEVMFAAFADVPTELHSDVVKRMIEKLRILTEKAGSFSKFLLQLTTLARLKSTIAPILIDEIDKAMPIYFTKKEIEELQENDAFYKKGEARGEKIGELNKSRETAIELFLEGCTIQFVQKITKLPLEDLKIIQKELKG
jgi:hypothetical protein